ncbi:hypothetical protein [Algoriphagus confluentis]|uniref:PAS domain-containing protein n=1 Tax=Algoriphagus confluentis TaxID=1697556 RepID=A0ABQ6PSF4_9BACT|nr:hypothetical protein Aconfl_23200 [Algoriphagus confluentis]
MDSGHFYFVIMDVEGKVLKSNGVFEKIAPRASGKEFWNFLSLDTAEEFCYSLELMLGAPKIKRHLMLEHPFGNEDTFSQIWWEFSVITTPEGDISSVIGIGVGLQLLEEELPWDNLVDVLGFGKLVLDSRFRITNWDSRVELWFNRENCFWKNKDLLQTEEFGDDLSIFSSLQKLLEGENPVFFTFQGNSKEFGGLLSRSGQEIHFFMGPKEKKELNPPALRLFSDKGINLIPGAVFILDQKACLIQRNDLAVQLSETLFGAYLEEGVPLAMSAYPPSSDSLRFRRAIEEALNGNYTRFEIQRSPLQDEVQSLEVVINPICDSGQGVQGIFIYAWNNSSLQNKVHRLREENQILKKLALQPSHILRGPLSSMLGILDLVDFTSLSEENKKLFGYLKPLAEELDSKIRDYSKKAANLKIES